MTLWEGLYPNSTGKDSLCPFGTVNKCYYFLQRKFLDSPACPKVDKFCTLHCIIPKTKQSDIDSPGILNWNVAVHIKRDSKNLCYEGLSYHYLYLSIFLVQFKSRITMAINSRSNWSSSEISGKSVSI